MEQAVQEHTQPTNLDPSVPLTSLQRGQRGRISPDGLDHGDADYLRALGLRDHATLRLCRRGEPCIVEMTWRGGCTCRIGLARPIADRVRVTPIA